MKWHKKENVGGTHAQSDMNPNIYCAAIVDIPGSQSGYADALFVVVQIFRMSLSGLLKRS